jgi:hypothetical protein
MKRTAAEKKARDKSYEGKIGGDDYPYGLGVSLDHDSLSKLGIHTLPKVGSKIKLHAHAHVKSASEESRDGGQKTRRVELELRHMMLEALKPEHANDEEGNLKGAKAAMDKALDAQEMGKSKGGRKGKVTNKDLGSEEEGEAENG